MGRRDAERRDGVPEPCGLIGGIFDRLSRTLRPASSSTSMAYTVRSAIQADRFGSHIVVPPERPGSNTKQRSNQRECSQRSPGRPRQWRSRLIRRHLDRMRCPCRRSSSSGRKAAQPAQYPVCPAIRRVLRRALGMATYGSRREFPGSVHWSLRSFPRSSTECSVVDCLVDQKSMSPVNSIRGFMSASGAG